MTAYNFTPIQTISLDVATRKAARKKVIERARELERESYKAFMRKQRQLQGTPRATLWLCNFCRPCILIPLTLVLHVLHYEEDDEDLQEDKLYQEVPICPMLLDSSVILWYPS